jgi:hypothetical protein
MIEFNRSLFGGVNGSVKLRKFLERYGNEKIVDIKVGRQPINGIIRKILKLNYFHWEN